MKKFILTISSFLFAVCILFAFAACGEKACTVTWEPNYEGAEAVTRDVEQGTSVEEPAGLFSRNGKIIEFWSYDRAGEDRVTFPVKAEGSLRFYAQWRDAARYTLTFSSDGASEGSAPAPVEAYEGSTVTLPAGDGLLRDNHLLSGWQDENGEVFALGASYAVSGNASFKPVWTRAVTVTFDANGGEGQAPAAIVIAENGTVTLPGAGSLSKEGYTFDGWLDASGELHRAQTSVQVLSGNVAFKAAWNGRYHIACDIAYKADAQFKTEGNTGEEITLPEPEEVDNKEFYGWLYGGKTYQPDDRFTIAYEDVTFCADLRERGANVEYRDADGSLITSVFYRSGETVTEPADIFTASLSEFEGWVDAEGEAVVLSDITGDTAVYASYSVEFIDDAVFTYTLARGGYYYINGRSDAYHLGDYRNINFPVSHLGKPVCGIADASDFLNSVYGRNSDILTARIPSNWTKIGNYAFYNSSLESVEFAQDCVLASIGYAAFYGTKLTEITIPDSVTTIGVSAFSDCASLETATFGQESGVTKFSDGSANERSSIFANCTSLTDVTLPGHLEVIGLTAFQYCPIKTITLPASLRVIGQAAFNYCRNLQTVVIPEDSALEEIQRAGFGWCSALRTIDLPATVRTISYNAFTTCEALESITFGNVTEIGETAFFRCYALKRVNSEEDGVFNIPATVRELGIGAFAMCSAMKQVNFAAESELKTVGMYAFAANLYHDADHYPEGFTKGDYNYNSEPMSLESIEFPAGVETIGKYVLYHTFSLKTVNVAAGNTHYTADGRGLYENATHKLIAFALGSEETAYTLAADCVAMDEYVLSGDMRETTVYGTPKVQEVTLSQGLKVLPYTSFLCHAKLTKIVVPAGSELTTIEEAAFANCIKLASFNFEAATKLTVIGVEAFEDVAFTAITLPATLKVIGNYAFYKADLETVDFAAESVLETLGVGAFMGNDHIKAEGSPEFIGSNLRTFTLPKSVVSVGTLAFAYTSGLQTFTFEEGSQLTGFANNMFQWSGVQSVENIPETLTAIGESAFARTSRLTGFTMNTVESIGLYAFSNSAIQTVVLRGNYETLTVRTFDTCKSLTSVTLGDRVKMIGNYAFVNCTALGEIVLPASCTSIGSCTFRACTSLKRITLPTTRFVSIAENTFDLSESEAEPGNLELEAVFVPGDLIEAYRADTYWRIYADRIRAIES